MAHSWQPTLAIAKSGPIVAKIFKSFGSKSNINQDIVLKFSAFVHHTFVQIWQKILAITQTACRPRPILAETLAVFSKMIRKMIRLYLLSLFTRGR